MTVTTYLKCDLCGVEAQIEGSNNSIHWSHMSLGVKLIGHKDYQDLCPQCTMWFYKKTEERIQNGI